MEFNLMIGYKCNNCGDRISENKYERLKELGNLTCLECGKGNYESFFIEEEVEEDYNNKNKGFSNSIKDMVKSTDNLPGATKTNRIIGAVTAGILGGLIIPIPFLNLAVGAALGWVFAPYFVPKLEKLVRWLKKEITGNDGDNE